jgi:hypothetical protein
MHPPDPEPATQAHRMLAQCRHNCTGPACRVDELRTAYLAELARQLPDLDQAVIGRVVMAAVTAATDGIRTVRPRVRDDYEAHEGALAILGATGARLYLDAAPQAPRGALAAAVDGEHR